jgi:hypothetical protein
MNYETGAATVAVEIMQIVKSSRWLADVLRLIRRDADLLRPLRSVPTEEKGE